MTAETPTAARSTPSGVITLTRHGEPALSRKVRLNATQYRDWWARYEEGGLKLGQTPPAALLTCAAEAEELWCSTRKRSMETAAAVVGGRDVRHDVGLIEAPLPPPRFPDWVRLSPRLWGFVSRVWWWYLDHHEDGESRAEAQRRAEAAADRFIAAADQGRDVFVVAHGFFNAMVGRVLRRRGWRLVENGGFAYWGARRYRRR